MNVSVDSLLKFPLFKHFDFLSRSIMAAAKHSEIAASSILRIADVIREPLKMLTPICGYEKMPLVSLEKAVEELVPILPTVQSHAYCARQQCQNPADGLSPDESAAIMLYTMGWEPREECLYVVLNKILRSANREQKLKPWYLYLRLLLNALLRLPRIKAVVHRGVKLNMSKNYMSGSKIVWWGFSSCTKTVEVLQPEEFLGQSGPRTLFSIQCKTARDIRKHSYFPNEDEVLLLAATQFKITGCLQQGDLCIVYLKETSPPYPLLQPVPIVVATQQMPSSSKTVN